MEHLSTIHRGTRKLVVSALIRNEQGQILLTKRPAHKPWPGYWEFPGGKIEEQESPVDALARELLEELDVVATVGQIYDVVSYQYPDFMLLMLVYCCSISTTPKPVDVAEIRFVHAEQLSNYTILPADEPIVQRLMREHSALL